VFLQNQRKWQCKSVHAKRQFSAKVGTIFEDSALPLDKWLIAIWMVANCKNVSVLMKLAALWRYSKVCMVHASPHSACNAESVYPQSWRDDSEVEVDETFIGGAARNMHREKHRRRITETGTKDKTAVFGILQRGGEVRAMVVPNRKKHALQTTCCSRQSRKRDLLRCAHVLYGLKENSGMKLSTMQNATLTDRFIPTDSKISGACSSVD